MPTRVLMPRVVRNGHPRNDLITSAHVDSNGSVFPQVLALYVPHGSRIADVTFGRGAFWREIPANRYELLTTDLDNGVDCRNLPYQDGSVDCVVLDPPYMHSPGGTAHTPHGAFERYYRNNRPNTTDSKYHDAVLDLYVDAGREAWRVLRERGVLIVKCQDEVCSNRQRLTHIEITERYREQGFEIEDLFVVVRTNSPGVSRVVRQVHARKNHSYFLVFWKRGADAGAWEAPVSAVDLFLKVVKSKTRADKWTGAPLEDYRRLGNTTRGTIGEEFVRRYLAQFGIVSTAGKSRVAKTDLTVGLNRIEIKTASEDVGGHFQFNHVRYDRNYDYLLCLGVQPAALVFALWSKGDVAESKAGSMVRMAEGQSVTFKLTKSAKDMRPIEELPLVIRALQDKAPRPKRSSSAKNSRSKRNR